MNPIRTQRRSERAYKILDVLDAHMLDDGSVYATVDRPGWRTCSCGWSGYWCDWHPHVAETIDATLTVPTTT